LVGFFFGIQQAPAFCSAESAFREIYPQAPPDETEEFLPFLCAATAKASSVEYTPTIAEKLWWAFFMPRPLAHSCIGIALNSLSDVACSC
jgi:hypothetical protein